MKTSNSCFSTLKFATSHKLKTEQKPTWLHQHHWSICSGSGSVPALVVVWVGGHFFSTSCLNPLMSFLGNDAEGTRLPVDGQRTIASASRHRSLRQARLNLFLLENIGFLFINHFSASYAVLFLTSILCLYLFFLMQHATVVEIFQFESKDWASEPQKKKKKNLCFSQTGKLSLCWCMNIDEYQGAVKELRISANTRPELRNDSDSCSFSRAPPRQRPP